MKEEGGVLGPHFSCLSAPLPQPLATLGHLKTQQREHTEAVVPVEERVPRDSITLGTACACCPWPHAPRALGRVGLAQAGRGEPDLVSVHLLCVHVSDWGTGVGPDAGWPIRKSRELGVGGPGGQV